MSDNKKRAYEDGNDTAIQSKRPPSGDEKVDIHSQAAARAQSPEATRLHRGDMKVSSLENGNLRGGNFVLDCDGNATTLSFAFEKDGAVYGLTAGHLADVGDSIFVFLLSSRTPNNDFDDGASSYEMLEVGQVVSKDTETDSLIFDIQHPYMNGKVDLLKLLPGSGLADRALRLPEPDVNPVPPRRDTKVVLYGASSMLRRAGEAGRVTIPSKPCAGTVSKKGDIGIISSLGNGARPLSSDGDCGALYVTEDGLALAMHHCLQGREEAPYVSFGIPLASILAKHSLLGGEQPEGGAAGSQLLMASPSVQLRKSPRDKYSESRNITKFDAKITRAIPPLGSTPIDEADIYESRDIAHFKNVRVVKK